LVVTWSLDSSDVPPVVVPDSGAGDESGEPIAVEQDGHEDEAEAAPATLVASVPAAEWLRTIAVPVGPGGQQASGAPGQKSATDTAVPAGTGAVEPSPDRQARGQSTTDMPLPVEPDPGVELTGKPVARHGDTAARQFEPAPKNAEPVATGGQAGEQPVVSIGASFESAAAEVMGETTPAPKSSAAAQFSKAMERIGGPMVHNVAPPVEVQQDGPSGDQAGFGPTGQDQQAGLNSGSTRLSPGGQAFSTQFASELQRQPQAAATASVPTTAVPDQAAAAPDGDTALQIVQAMRLQFRDGIGDAVVRLKPGHLGEVSISLRVDQQSVSATVHAEVPAVRQWLESQESSLRSGLADQGLHLEKFVVKEDQPRQREKEAQDAEAREQARRLFRQRRSDSEQKFEVVV
jgi:flagellar hook-length control protein FliK